MLSLKEKNILKKISDKCGEKKSCLIYREELVAPAGGVTIGLKEVDGLVSSLSLDGYIDAVITFRKGERAYCIALTDKGRGFKREQTNSRRYVAFRLAIAAVSAAVTFLVGRLLYLIAK